MTARWLAGCVSALCLSAHGQPVDAEAFWSGDVTESGYRAVYGFADDPESVLASAGCNSADGLVMLWIHADRPLLPGQVADADGLRRPIDGLVLSLSVQGQRFTYSDALARPEEMYGGNELVLTLRPEDPLWQALINGDRLRIELADGWHYDLPLNASAEPFKALIRHCGNN